MSLSSLIKSAQIFDGQEKVIIAAPFSSPVPQHGEEREKKEDLQQKVQLTREIEQLEARLALLRAEHQSVQSKIQEEKKQAQTEIEAWWSSKKKEAQVKVQEMMKKAEQEGVEQGFQQGYLQGQAEWQEANQKITEVVELAYKEKDQIIQSAEPFLLLLSESIARKIISNELQQHPDQVVHTVKQTLQEINEKGQIIIQVSPQQYPLLLPFTEELKQCVGSEAELKIVPNHQFQGDGCLIQTPIGSYDARIDSQLSEIKKNLLSFYKERTGQ